MKPNPFRYHSPRSPEEALDLLAGLDNAKVLAGGQSLVAMLNLRYAMPDDLVDINGLTGFAGIEATHDRISIGATTRQRALERDRNLIIHAPIFGEALYHVGHIQTRNRGTIGGSLCHLDPSAELPALCMLYDAWLVARSRSAERRIPMAEFPAFYMTPSLTPDEILTRIELVPWPSTSGYAFQEFARRHGDFAIVGAGCLISRSGDGTIERAAIVLAGVGSAPMRLPEAETSLIGTRGEADAVAAAAAFAAEIDAMEDDTYSADYRRHLARVLTRRTLTTALERAA